MEALLSRPREFDRLPHQHAKGRATEDLACRWLAKNGYRIVERNWSSNLGELDVIAVEDETLCFVEVKARRSARYGRATAAVGRKKQQRIARIASLYLVKNPWPGPCRFDVLGLDARGDETWAYELIRNAFEAR